MESSPRREKSSSQEAIRGEEGDVRVGVKAERNDDVSGAALRIEAETRGGS